MQVIFSYLLLEQISIIQHILLPALRHVLQTVLDQNCDWWCHTTPGKNVQEWYPMDHGAVAQECQAKDLDFL